MVTHQELHDLFSKLGLSQDVSKLYLALHRHGSQSISELSRNAKVERTRIYRLLNSLKTAGIVEVEIRHKRHILKAAPLSSLKVLITQKEQQLSGLYEELAKLEKSFETKNLHSPLTSVHFYQGPEGYKQMFWNETKAQTEVLAILCENMQVRTNSRFFERWAARCNELGIVHRGIVGETYLASQKDWYARHNNERLKYWHPRFVPESEFPIVHSTVIYNDVVAYYSWKDDEIFGIEIYNQDIAMTQRRFFEMLWQKGKPVRD